MRALSIVLLLFAAVSPAVAQTFTSYLLPLAPAQNVRGARGSLWTTDLVIENSSDHPITIQNSDCIVVCPGPAPPGGPVTIPPQSAVTNPPVVPLGSVGGFLFVQPADAGFVRMHLRVRDTSREAETFGTEVPVVPQPAFRQTIRLIDIPTDPRFRVTLRIYSRSSNSATVTVLPASGTTPLRTQLVPIVNFAAQLDPVSGLSDPSVRIVVDSGSPQTPIWAFASITNNDTQDVTTITESQ